MSVKIIDVIGSFDGEAKIHEFENNMLGIVNDAGQRLYDITLENDGTLVISTNDTVKIGDKIFDTQMKVVPRFSNTVIIERAEYKIIENK